MGSFERWYSPRAKFLVNELREASIQDHIWFYDTRQEQPILQIEHKGYMLSVDEQRIIEGIISVMEKLIETKTLLWKIELEPVDKMDQQMEDEYAPSVLRCMIEFQGLKTLLKQSHVAIEDVLSIKCIDENTIEEGFLYISINPLDYLLTQE